MQWHPDRPHNYDNVAEATAKFQAVKDAYDSLTRLAREGSSTVVWANRELSG